MPFAAVARPYTSYHFVHFPIPSLLPVSSISFCHRPTFSFSYNVVPSELPFVLFIRDYLQFSFVLAPRHSFSHPHACFILRTSSLRATGVAPKRLTLAPPPFLRPVGILLPAPLPPRQPRACNAPTTLPGWTVWLHDILLRVYDETQLLLTFARTMSPCQVGKHVYLIACTDIPVLIPDSRARDAIYLVVVLLHDGSIGHNRLNFVCSLE